MGRRHWHLNDRIFGLDFMRACAIIMVLFGHLTWILPPQYERVNAVLALSGFLGVEIFFVLSGFLIGTILFRTFMRDTFTLSSVKQFLKRRWFRTLPTYFLILCANIAIGIGIVGYNIDGLWRYFFFLQNFSTKMPLFFPESWSLSVEEFAYLLLPAVLWLSIKIVRNHNRTKLFLLAVLVLYIFFIATKFVFTLNCHFTTLADWNVYLKGVVIYRVDAILTGVIAAWIAAVNHGFWHRTRWLAAVSSVACGLVLLAAAQAGKGIETNLFFWNVFFLPIMSVAIAATLPLLSAWKQRPNHIGKPIVTISLISYSMYLLHYGVVMQLLHQFTIGIWHWQAITIIYFATTFALSYLLYKYFEKPITDLRDQI